LSQDPALLLAQSAGFLLAAAAKISSALPGQVTLELATEAAAAGMLARRRLLRAAELYREGVGLDHLKEARS
jgi:hypothetical protein